MPNNRAQRRAVKRNVKCYSDNLEKSLDTLKITGWEPIENPAVLFSWRFTKRGRQMVTDENTVSGARQLVADILRWSK